MKKRIEDVLDQISEDILTEDSKQMLTEAFEEAVAAAVEEKVELQVESALKQLDEEHADKMSQLIEAIDVDHSAKLVAVLQRLDEEHTEKLQYLIARHQKVLREDAAEFKAKLTKQLSNYLELYIEKAIPHEQLREAVQNKKAQKMVEQIKQVVSLDDEFINETIKEAVQDGRKTIDSLKRELNEAVKDNIKISQDLKQRSAELLIEKNTAGLVKEKKEYVVRMLKGKDPEYIKENFDYVVKMFDKEEDENRRLVTEKAKSSSKVITEKVDVPKGFEKKEAPKEPEGGVGGYLSEMKRQDRFSR